MRVKVAVVGAGSMGMNHLRVLADFDEELFGALYSLNTGFYRTITLDKFLKG